MSHHYDRGPFNDHGAHYDDGAPHDDQHGCGDDIHIVYLHEHVDHRGERTNDHERTAVYDDPARGHHHHGDGHYVHIHAVEHDRAWFNDQYITLDQWADNDDDPVTARIISYTTFTFGSAPSHGRVTLAPVRWARMRRFGRALLAAFPTTPPR